MGDGPEVTGRFILFYDHHRVEGLVSHLSSGPLQDARIRSKVHSWSRFILGASLIVCAVWPLVLAVEIDNHTFGTLSVSETGGHEDRFGEYVPRSCFTGAILAMLLPLWASDNLARRTSLKVAGLGSACSLIGLTVLGFIRPYYLVPLALLLLPGLAAVLSFTLGLITQDSEERTPLGWTPSRSISCHFLVLGLLIIDWTYELAWFGVRVPGDTAHGAGVLLLQSVCLIGAGLCFSIAAYCVFFKLRPMLLLPAALVAGLLLMVLLEGDEGDRVPFSIYYLNSVIIAASGIVMILLGVRGPSISISDLNPLQSKA